MVISSNLFVLATGNKNLKYRVTLFTLFFGLTLLFGCAPKIYNVDLRYQPTKQFAPTLTDGRKLTVTVASFIDRRKMDDTLLVGRVIRSGKSSIPVLPRYVKAPDAVAEALRKLLLQSGFNVSPEKVAWDQQETNIRPGWGTILIGGTIDDLDVTCIDNIPLKQYSAKARISLVFADVQKKKIFYRVSSEASSTLEHIVFSEDKLEGQINGVVAEAMEKIFEGKETARQILEAVKQQHP
jgi:hypothetical protein